MCCINIPLYEKAFIFRESKDKIGSRSSLQLGWMEMREEPLWKGSVCNQFGGTSSELLVLAYARLKSLVQALKYSRQAPAGKSTVSTLAICRFEVRTSTEAFDRLSRPCSADTALTLNLVVFRFPLMHFPGSVAGAYHDAFSA